MDNLRNPKYIIAALAFVALIVGIYFLFVFQKGPKEIKNEEVEGEVKSLEEIELSKRPFATLTPTSDGAEIIISIENMNEFENIEYELVYLADNPQIAGEKIQRGSTGTDVNTKEEKYKKSILLGTASRGVRSPDKGIEEGKLTMHAFKGVIEYQIEVPWKLTQAGSRAGVIEDSQAKLEFLLPSLGKDHYIIIADTIGVPKVNRQIDVSKVRLPILGIFSVVPEFTKSATVSIKIDSLSPDDELYSYTAADSAWTKLSAKFDESQKTLSASVDSFATFVVVSPK